MPHSPAQKQDQLALGIALGLILVWGANFTVQKYLFGLLSPSGFLMARYLIMPVLALGLMRYRLGQFFPPMSRADLIGLAKLGLVGHALHVSLVTYGIYWSTAFSSSVILACGPVFTLLILRLQGLERFGLRQVLGVAVAMLGVLLFLSDKLLGGDWRATGGDLVLLLAASLFSYYTVMAKTAMERHGSVRTMGYATLFGGLPVLLFAVPLGSAAPWGELGWLAWLGIFWSVVVSAFVGWLVWGWVNTVRGVARTAPLMYLMPPVAGAFAWALTGEQFTGIKIAGAALALLGVALAQSGRPTPQKTSG